MHDLLTSLEQSGIIPEEGQWLNLRGEPNPVRVLNISFGKGTFTGEHIIPVDNHLSGMLVRREYDICKIINVVEKIDKFERMFEKYGIENYLLTFD